MLLIAAAFYFCAGRFDTEDIQANNDALEHGGRLYFSYSLPDGGKV